MQERDPEFARGERRLAAVLEELQDLYLLRLDHALQAVYAVQRRSDGRRLRADELAEAIGAVRDLDAAHLRRVGAVRGEFYEGLRPHDRPVIAEHRADVTGLLADAAAVAVAGGHVGVLADTLHLFNIAASLRSPVIAWSACAMALTDRIVLFNDRAPQGPGHPERSTTPACPSCAIWSRCRMPARGCCSARRHAWPSSPAGSHPPAVSCWSQAHG